MSFVKTTEKLTGKIWFGLIHRQLKKRRKIKPESITKAICNKGFSGNSSVLPRIKFGAG